ncbi:MAG: hypothetical protein GTO18_21085 [Anaerolineales bacterium]|nr:hypothetical protein [Anaerolineales bacterium]
MSETKVGGIKIDVAEVVYPATSWLGKVSDHTRSIPTLYTIIGTLVEIALIFAWAIFVGQEYLDFDPNVWPLGGDFALTIQPYFAWLTLPTCKGCVFWNGFINGGYPAFVESHGAFLHPLVVATTFIFGVLNGAKLTLVISFALAGVALWWLARSMGLGVIPRLWIAGIAVTGGYITGKMEIGLSAIILSTAFGALAIAPALQLAETGSRRNALALAILTALAIFSGQVYIQGALIITLITAAVIFCVNRGQKGRSILREFALSGIIAILLAGIFLIPFLHFLPHFRKHLDVTLAASQPLRYQPLHLVINDFDFYHNTSMEKLPFPSIYVNYIGWLPVIFAFFAVLRISRRNLRRYLFFLVPIILLYILSSSDVLKILLDEFPNTIGAIRYPSLFLGLAVPLILGLAAWGLDQFLNLNWPTMDLKITDNLTIHLKALNLTILLLLGWSIKSTYDFSQNWLNTYQRPPEIEESIDLFKTETTQWVKAPPQHIWYPALFEENIKATNFFRPWYWAYMQSPSPKIETIHTSEDDETIEGAFARVDSYQFIKHSNIEYAYVTTGSEAIPCQAEAIGGNIDVICNNESPGILFVEENYWTGWNVEIDGERADMLKGEHLAVSAPAGEHHYAFRYRPLDVVFGMIVSFIGLLIVVWLWLCTFRLPSKTELANMK